MAENITLEQGKTLGDSRGDVFRGLGAIPRSIARSLTCDVRRPQCIDVKLTLNEGTAAVVIAQISQP